MGPQDIKPQFTEEKLKKTFNDVLKDKTNQEKNVLTTVHQRKDGSIFPVEVYLTCLEDNNIIVASVRDISDRAKIKKKLTEAYQIINASSSVAFTWKNESDWPILFVSENVENIFGYIAEEFLSGKINYNSCIHPDDRDRVIKEVTEYSERNNCNEFQHQPYRIITKNGDIKWVNDWTLIIRDNTGDIIQYKGIIEDITERKNALDELLESEERYRDLFENANDLIQSVRPDGTFIYVNKQWKEILKYSDDELSHLKFTDIIRSDYLSHCQQIFDELKQGKKIDCIETIFVSKDGGEIHVEGNINSIMKNGEFLGSRGIFRDVTNQKKVLAELKESNKKYETLVEQSIDAVIIVQDQKVIFANNGSVKMLKYSKDELIGMHFLDAIPDSEKEKLATNYKKRMNDEKIPSFYESKLLRKDHSVIPVEISSKKIEYNHKPAILAIIRDISERKESEKKYKSFVENANDIVYSLSLDGTFTYVSPNWTEILGHDINEVIGKSFAEFVHPDDLPKCQQFLEKIISTKQKQQGVRYRVKHLNGQYVWHTSNASPILDEEGNVSLYVGIARDITDVKNAEDELVKSNERFKSLFNNANDAIFLMDGVTFIDCNPKAEEIFKTKKEKMLGKTPMDYSPEFQPNGVSSKNMASEKIGNALEGKFQYFEWEHIINGKSVICEISISTVPTEDKTLLLVLLRDISERKNIEKKIENQNDELRMVNQELEVAREQLTDLNQNLEEKVRERTQRIEALLQHKNDFISNLNHDLRTPLGPLVSLLPILKNRCENEKNKEMIDLLIRNVDRMKEMTKKTLTLNEMNAMTTKFILKPVQLKTYVDQMINQNSEKLHNKNITVRNEIDPGFVVNIDEKYVYELFQQLISNALKYVKESGNLKFSAKVENEMVKVEVSDDGIGMTQDQLQFVFDEFYKADQSRHDLYSSGLGLSICKRIVEKHGGRIWAESEGLDKGSSFYFTLPSPK
jgi:PAS domain S-box-containing protein